MNLEDEYSELAARQAKARAEYQKRLRKQQQAQNHKPIEDRQQLSDAAAQLAAAWGLKPKRK